ncbi:hypothetical protein [Photobacterium nomapromontoriensis]|uniref:hypothetical protein n=1 Tax=Photobacterium nomapromontoriensis TaxID=2910237 RepID=UPI003D0D1E67
MRAAIQRRPATAKEEQDWQDELASWGIESDPFVKIGAEAETEVVTVWDEHQSVLEWWLDIPAFLRWNGPVCLGMDVCQVKADADLSNRTINPDDYHKLKLIAHTMTEELNCRE